MQSTDKQVGSIERSKQRASRIIYGISTAGTPIGQLLLRYQDFYGNSIALPVQSLNPTLQIYLVTPYH